MSDRLALAFMDVRASDKHLRGDLKRVEKTTEDSFGRMNASLLAAGVTTASGIMAIRWGLQAAGDAETATTAINVMIKDMEKTEALLKRVNAFSEATPFTPKDVIAATRQMLAFQVTAENIPKRLQTLGDIAAGVNKPLGDIAFIFNKIKSQGKLTGETFQMLNERGITIGPAIAKSLGKTNDEFLKSMSKSEIGFDQVLKAMEGMTTEGGLFFQAMVKQSTTWNGLISTMEGRVEGLAKRFGGALLPAGKKTVEMINAMIGRFGELDDSMDNAISQTMAYTVAIGTMATAMIAAKAAAKAMGITVRRALMATGIGLFLVGLGMAIVAMEKLFAAVREGAEEGNRWKGTLDALLGAWIAISETAQTIGNMAIAIWNSFFEQWGLDIQMAKETGLDWIARITEALATGVQFMAVGIKTLVEHFDLAWAAFRNTLAFAISFGIDLFFNFFAMIPQLAMVAFGAMGDIALAAWHNIKAAFSGDEAVRPFDEMVRKATERLKKVQDGMFAKSDRTRILEADMMKAGNSFGDAFNKRWEENKRKVEEFRKDQQKPDPVAEKETEKAVNKAVTNAMKLELQFVGFEDLNKNIQDAFLKAENPNAKLESLTGETNAKLGEVLTAVKANAPQAIPVANAGA